MSILAAKLVTENWCSNFVTHREGLNTRACSLARKRASTLLNHRVSEMLDVHSTAQYQSYADQPAGRKSGESRVKRGTKRQAHAAKRGIEIFIGVAGVACTQPIYIFSRTRKEEIRAKRMDLAGEAPLDRLRSAPTSETVIDLCIDTCYQIPRLQNRRNHS